MKTGENPRWLSYAIVPLAGLTLASYVFTVLVKKGVPNPSSWPFIVLLLVSTGFLFSILGILSRCAQLFCGLDYRSIRSNQSLAFLPVFILLSYIATQRAVQESVIDFGFTQLATETIYHTLVVGLSIITALSIMYLLWQREVRPVERSFGAVLGRLFFNIVLVVLFTLFGVRIFDFSLLRQIQRDTVRYAINDETRSVVACPIPSKIDLHLEVADGSALYSGFGIAPEALESMPAPLVYTVSVSTPGRSSREWMKHQVGEDFSPGWVEKVHRMSASGDTALDLKMKVQYAEHSFFAQMLDLCRYYLRLVCVPDYRFDISHRMAFWIVPSVAKERRNDETNVILIGIDTLRSDHVSSYQYHRLTTPNIDRLAKKGVVFKKCRSVSPWTLPSFFSMMSSTYPSVHLYGTNVRGITMPALRFSDHWTVGTISPDYSIKTLAEILREQDYYTAAFINNVFLSRAFEMDRGFEEHNHYGPTAKEGVEKTLRWLEKHGEEKFFLFIHFLEPHEYRAGGFALNGMPKRFGSRDDDGLAGEINTYDTYIHFCDEQIGELVRNLNELGLERDTLIVVTSDHGEELFDHGTIGHGQSLYEELLQVPLIFYLPQRMEGGKVFKNRVSTLDILPTILDILRLPSPPYFQGESLMPLLAGDTLTDRPLFAEVPLYGNEKKALLMNNYKLIYATTQDEFELYDLKNDPKESRNLVEELPDVEYQLRQTLQLFHEQSNRGIQIVFNSGHAKDVCSGKLTTTGIFINVAPAVLSGSRIFQVDRGAKEIRFSLGSSKETRGFAFEVDPSDASIQLELAKSNTAPMGVYLGSALRNSQSTPVVFDKKTLRQSGAISSPDMGKRGIYVWLKEGNREAKPLEIDAKTRKRLEALGYLN